MTSKTKTTLASAIFGVAICFLSQAEDWPQYRGPDHDGHSSEKILESWPATGLRAIWKVPLSDGFSSFAVGSGKAFTLIARDVDGAQQEVCVALDANTGKEIWAATLGIAKYDGGGNSGAPDNQGGDGPRSTPAVSEGRVYTLSARLVLKCFDADSGKLIWSHDIVRENEGQKIHWQNASSPVLDGDLVFVMGGGPGQALLAFNQKDGRLVWKGQDDRMTHSTPTVATILGVRQVIFFTQNGLVGVETKTGKLLWRYPFRYSTSTAMTPVASGDMIYCSAGYGVGASACKITKTGNAFAATQLWFEPASVLNSHWSTPVSRDGYIYGLFGTKQFGRAPLECVELATGKIMWSHPDFGPGGCALVDGQSGSKNLRGNRAQPCR
jgi:outer membrane protein assembly factor BamB